MAVINTVTSVAVWDTFAVAAREGIGPTLQCGGLVGRIVNTRLMVGQQLHAVWTATHPLRVWDWKAEVATVSIRIGQSVAEVET